MTITQQDIDRLTDADLSTRGENKAREYYTVEDLIQNMDNL